MTPAEIVFVRQTFGLTQRSLAKSLNVSPHTVTRWEANTSAPTGLQEEVLRALHNVALEVTANHDAARQALVGGLVALGVGALIFYLLRQANA